MYLCSNIYIVEYYIVIAYHLLSNIEVYVVFILRFMYVTKHPCFKLKSYKIYCTLLLHLTLFDDVTFIYKAIFRIRISDGKCRSLFGKLYCVGTELVQITLTDLNKLAHEESFTMLIIIVEKFHVHKYVSKSQSIFIEVTSTPITLNVAEVKNSKLNHCDEKIRIISYYRTHVYDLKLTITRYTSHKNELAKFPSKMSLRNPPNEGQHIIIVDWSILMLLMLFLESGKYLMS